MDRVYFDNAATTSVHPLVLDRMIEVLRDCYGNPSSIHKHGRQSRTIIEEARKTVAEYLKASIGEVFFTSGGTEATNTALKCAVRDLGIRRIISSPIEHHCVGHTIERLVKTDSIDVEMVSLTTEGRPDLEDLRKMLSSQETPTLVSLMHANNEIGTITDLHAVGKICHEHGALFHSDTVQTFGHFPFDLTQTPIDFMTGSAHKFHGPKGIGILYINANNAIKPFMDGGGQERNMRAGTENLGGIVGLSTALKIAIEKMDDSRMYISSLKEHMKSKLLELDPTIGFHGDPNGESLYTVLNVAFPAMENGDMLLLNLDIEGICASGGSACTSGASKGSHVIQHLYPNFEGTSVRFSFSDQNNIEEVDFVIQKLAKILG